KLQTNLVTIPAQNLVDDHIETGAWRTLIVPIFDQRQRRVRVAPVMTAVSVYRRQGRNHRLVWWLHQAMSCIESRSDSDNNNEDRFDHVRHRFPPSWILWNRSSRRLKGGSKPWLHRRSRPWNGKISKFNPHAPPAFNLDLAPGTDLQVVQELGLPRE